MKTKEELQLRISVLQKEISLWNEKFQAYGNIDTPINEWEGRTLEFKKLEEMTTEEFFIQRALKYLF